jgi:hypothetical protein
MTKKQLGALLVALGVLLFLGAAVADNLGLGLSPGLGGLQIGGMMVGVVIAVIGMTRLRGKPPE